jgi:hypothetical protein
MVLHNGNANTGVEDGDRGETYVDHKPVKLAGVGNEAVSKGLVGGVGDIGSHKFEPGRGVSKTGLVGNDAVELTVVRVHVKLGGVVHRDHAGRRSRVGNYLLSVVLIHKGGDNGFGGRDDTIVVNDAANELVKVLTELVVGGSASNNHIGGGNDERRKRNSRVRAVNSHDGLGNDGTIHDFSKIGPRPASSCGNHKEIRVGKSIYARRNWSIRGAAFLKFRHFFLF